MNVDALRKQAAAEGRTAIFDIPANQWRIVYGPDAREMIRAKTGSLTGPEQDVTITKGETAPTDDPDEHDDLSVMEPAGLAKTAAELGVKNISKMSRDDLVAAIKAARAAKAK